jgi:hypothetical protein
MCLTVRLLGYAARSWIIDNQKGRRNVSDIDKIALASKREEIVARQAKEKQESQGHRGSEGGRGRKKNPSGDIAERVSPVDTRKEAAKSAGGASPRPLVISSKGVPTMLPGPQSPRSEKNLP